MLATDGSHGAERAAAVAAELARATGSKLSIVTVGGNTSGNDLADFGRSEGSIGDALEALSKQILLIAKETAQRAGVSDIQVQSGWGDPAEVIIEAARRDQADAIVMGRRGRGRLVGLLLGSVSQKVASLAPCSVIVVP
jgi:nucleotide-binding universal stress UspA family protein